MRFSIAVGVVLAMCGVAGAGVYAPGDQMAVTVSGTGTSLDGTQLLQFDPVTFGGSDLGLVVAGVGSIDYSYGSQSLTVVSTVGGWSSTINNVVQADDGTLDFSSATAWASSGSVPSGFGAAYAPGSSGSDFNLYGSTGGGSFGGSSSSGGGSALSSAGMGPSDVVSSLLTEAVNWVVFGAVMIIGLILLSRLFLAVMIKSGSALR
jgi:hypothetical protein